MSILMDPNASEMKQPCWKAIWCILLMLMSVTCFSFRKHSVSVMRKTGSANVKLYKAAAFFFLAAIFELLSLYRVDRGLDTTIMKNLTK